MLPVVALVGRPNVGKSTLFNALTRTRDALVADLPGVTRDRLYGLNASGGCPFIVVDTGGIGGEPGGPVATVSTPAMARLIAEQAANAIDEADVLVLLVDAREGWSAEDSALATRLRATGKPLVLAINKAEGREPALVLAEFAALGLPHVLPVSAAHRRGLTELIERLCELLPAPAEPATETDPDRVRVAVIGRPNVGKSTLVNRLLGRPRVITSDIPGTTRDAVAVPLERRERRYLLIDTAGLRRKSRVEETVEKFSALKTLAALAEAEVALVVLDAQAGVSELDVHVLGLAIDSGRGLVIAVNKWDGLPPEQRRRVADELTRRLAFLPWARPHMISALHGSGVGDLLAAIDAAHESATRKLSTATLNRLLAAAVQAHAPPLVGGRRSKLRYAHQGGSVPPLIVIHGTQTHHLPGHYTRYLEQFFRSRLQLTGTPVRVEYRDAPNPYAPDR